MHKELTKATVAAWLNYTLYDKISSLPIIESLLCNAPDNPRTVFLGGAMLGYFLATHPEYLDGEPCLNENIK